MSENLPPDASPPKKPGSRRQGVPAAPDEGSARGIELPMASAAPAGGRESAAPGPALLRGVPLEIDPAGSFRLELVLRPESRTGGVYPFATLGQNGRYARVLLARVASADGVPFRYLALKVQRDRYDVETDRGNVLSNVEIAELWEEEHLNLKLLRGDPEGAAAELLGGDTPLRVLPPATFCRKREVFFQPPCPSCGKVLRDCEDDGLLTRRGLPRYSESNIRYLHCPACLRTSPDGPLYRLRIEEKERRQGVKDSRALIADWKTLALSGPNGGQGPGTETEFPCRGCPHAGECYGAAAPQAQAGAGTLMAVDRLTALSAYDFRVIPIEVLRLRYDEFVDCLGGIGWDDFLGEHRGGREDIPERIFLADLRPRMERADRYLFSGCGGLEALEVFRLKLALFTQLVRRVRRFHELTGKAHLDLKPENAMVDVPPVPAELPILWNFRVKLIDLCAATAFVYGEDGSRKSLPSPPVNYAEVYTSPIIRHGQFGHLRPCDLQITGTTDLGDGRRRISARLRSSDLIPGSTRTRMSSASP